jgi:hypothetical protein
MTEGDACIFASDGLGDTLDPVQLYPKPSLVHGFESIQSWQQFSATIPHATSIARDMKERVLDRLTHWVLQPHYDDKHTSPSSAFADFKVSRDKVLGSTQSRISVSRSVPGVSAKALLRACLDHTKDATKGIFLFIGFLTCF